MAPRCAAVILAAVLLPACAGVSIVRVCCPAPASEAAQTRPGAVQRLREAVRPSPGRAPAPRPRRTP